MIRFTAWCTFIRLGLALLFPLTATTTTTLAQSESPPPIPREFRAAWIASVWNLHWPSKPGLTTTQQQAELTQLLDLAKKLRLNAVILQVRPAADALYDSNLEPWSHHLTGQMGKSPGYDPLAFAVKEAHDRGLELHAWFNPFRASISPSVSPSENHVTQTNPDDILSVYSYKWLNPGSPFARNHALKVITDVVQRYDVDGVHIDDYFYPYPKNPSTGPAPIKDNAAFDAYRENGGSLELHDWRRQNIDTFVEELYAAVKAEKPWVKVGISPFGIYRPGIPESIDATLDSYDHIFADSLKWLHQGWCDYMSPQLYWRIDDKPHSFTTLTDWWKEENKAGRHLWPGIASDRIAKSPDYRPASESLRQIEHTRTHDDTHGHIHWSIQPLNENRKDLATLLAKDAYPTLALVPASPWLSPQIPDPPTVRLEPGSTPTLKFPDDASPAISWFTIQTQSDNTWQTVAIIPPTQTTFTLNSTPDQIAVTTINRYGTQSPPTILTP
ncbi:MAG: family 10 glycosylhydrolase [Verrucomicrobiota bacterium]